MAIDTKLLKRFANVILFALSLLSCPTQAAEPDASALPVVPAPAAASGLANTFWELVQFEGGDGRVLIPEAAAKYTIAFENDGHLSARIACNHGRGTWRTESPSQLRFGPLALTRAMCRPHALLQDRLSTDWLSVRSYVLKDGRLYLSLLADSGIYEFQPIN